MMTVCLTSLGVKYPSRGVLRSILQFLLASVVIALERLEWSRPKLRQDLNSSLIINQYRIFIVMGIFKYAQFGIGYINFQNKFFKFLMFSKIKTLFSNPSNPEQKPAHPPHPEVEGGDISQCPFMSKKKDATDSKSNDTKTSDKKKKGTESETESQPEEKPRGGCPFMVSSGLKKNPNLGLEHQGYDEPFVSKFKYYLSGNKINFDLMRKGKSQQPITRHIFDQYPIYLKHTLFYNGEDFKKVRTLECCSRFLAYEELRERGNKNFNKGRYLKALDYYQRAMSLFRWLQYHEPQPESQIVSQAMLESQSQISEEESMSRVPINLSDKPSSTKEEKQDQFDEFRLKYKQFFIVYHDDNTKYFDGEEMTETVDTDMRKSLLIQLYLNMAAAYMKLNHFYLAKMVIADAFKLSEKVSQVYLRKAQIAMSNQSSTLAQLNEGLEAIQKAIEMQPNEKIFQNTNPNILKMVNIHDAKEVYGALGQQLKARIQVKQNQRKALTESMEKRLKDINRFEQDIIKEGKVPKQSTTNGLLSEGTDYKILRRIYDKYVRVMEFYTEAKEKDQVGLAKKEFQEILKSLSEIENIQSIQIDLQNPEFGNDERKIQNRLKNIKRAKCQQIYNSTKYNFHVLEWAIKEVVNEEHQQKERKKKQEEEARKAEAPVEQVKQKPNLMSKLPYAMLILPVIGIALNYLI